MEVIPPHGFTPVRRRELQPPNWQFNGTKVRAWTAARCHRLLRPLTSRILVLNKEQSRSSSETHSHSNQNLETVRSLSAEDIYDPDDGSISGAEWTRPRKRVKRTYSGRHGRGSSIYQNNSKKRQAPKFTNPLVPGEISVPTPIINRTRGQELCCSPVCHPSLPDASQDIKRNHRTMAKGSRLKLAHSLQSIRKLSSGSRCNTYEGIYNGLENLLRDTAASPSSNSRQKGASPLFSMCLKAIPRYIAEEEALASEEAAKNGNKLALETSDIATEIYDELENHSSSGSGWDHLRIVTRMHGIHIIINAIQSGVFDERFGETLVTLCAHTDAIEEAEIIVSSILSNKTFPTPRTIYSRFSDDESTHPLAILSELAGQTGRTSYQYRHVTSLISNGSLPIIWVATKEFAPLWTDAIRSLCRDSIDVEAFRFMETVLTLLASYIHPSDGGDTSPTAGNDLSDATKQTFSSLLATLAAIIILTLESGNMAQYRNIATLLRGCWAEYEHSKALLSNHVCLLLAANLIASFANQTNEPEFIFVERILAELRQHKKGLAGQSTSYSSLVLFISQVARCCSKSTVDFGFRCLKTLHKWLEDSICGYNGDEAGVLYELMIDSAFTFAQQMPHQNHLNYAENLNRRFHGKVATLWQSPFSGKSHNVRTGFRWEEGISEWIATTPALMVDKIKCFENWAQEDESDHESLSQSPLDSVKGQQKLEQVVDKRKRTITLRQASLESNSQQRGLPLQCHDELPSSPGVDELSSSSTSYHAESSSKDSIAECSPYPLIRSSSQNWKSTIKTKHDRVQKAPRVRVRILQESTMDWQIFDESSNDGLISRTTLFQDDLTLSDITNTVPRYNQPYRKIVRLSRSAKLFGYKEGCIMEDSEDELCV
ncbi:hypothetical protein B7463_g9331, partial [Scytalidium lignicola]